MLPRIPSPYARRARMPYILKARQAEGASECHSPRRTRIAYFRAPHSSVQMAQSCKAGIDKLTTLAFRDANEEKTKICQPDFALLRFTLSLQIVSSTKEWSLFQNTCVPCGAYPRSCPSRPHGEIDWNDRLIGIKGTRGVGKTTFLLQYAKEHFHVETGNASTSI